MHGLPDVVGQPVRALKGGRVGIKQLLEYPAGHERSVPLSRCVMRPCAFPSGPSLPCPPASSPDLTPSSIAAEAISSNAPRSLDTARTLPLGFILIRNRAGVQCSGFVGRRCWLLLFWLGSLIDPCFMVSSRALQLSAPSRLPHSSSATTLIAARIQGWMQHSKR